MTDKWMFVRDRECPFCEAVLRDEDYENEKIVTACKSCERSFLE